MSAHKKISRQSHLTLQFDSSRVKKDENGLERRYLYGIASGVRKDHHNQHMSENCINGFHNQFKSGNILLYVDKHDVDSLTDVGIATDSQISPDYNWIPEFRLYDEHDEGIDQQSIDMAGKLWAQVNGLSPYKKPVPKGFSIEGDGVLKKDHLGNEFFDYIDLTYGGVVVVPQPAYKESFVMAVRKQLHHATLADAMVDLRESVRDSEQKTEQVDSFWDRKWVLEEALERALRAIMRDDQVINKRELVLQKLLEYGELYADLVVQHPKVFEDVDTNHVVKEYRENERILKERAKKANIVPGAEELEEDFIGRCMADTQMQSDFPDQDQRAAVCFSKYREKKSEYEKAKKSIDANRSQGKESAERIHKGLTEIAKGISEVARKIKGDSI